MFKELFEKSSKDITMQLNKTYKTQNNFVVKIVKKSGIEKMGINFYDAEVIGGPTDKLNGKIIRYNISGIPSGFQDQSDKHIKNWKIKEYNV